MLLNEYEIEFIFIKIRNIRNLGTVHIRGPDIVMSRTDAQNGLDFPFNISFYQNNIIIKVFNYFWYRPLFVSAIYIKTVNTEHWTNKHIQWFIKSISVYNLHITNTQRFYVTRRMSGMRPFIHEIYSFIFVFYKCNYLNACVYSQNIPFGQMIDSQRL